MPMSVSCFGLLYQVLRALIIDQIHVAITRPSRRSKEKREYIVFHSHCYNIQ